MSAGLIIAAPMSGSGKTVVTLGLLRAFVAAGVSVASLKVGPDFIDPAFHAAASGQPARNLDLWAMREATCVTQIRASSEADLIVAEGVMGLFDGAGDDTGSSADVAACLGWPVVLVIDVHGQAASAAALAEGFANHRREINVAGVIINRVASQRHRDFVSGALRRSSINCFGYVLEADELVLPSRHLGLVQAGEQAELESWLQTAGEIMGRSVDLDGLRRIARPMPESSPSPTNSPLPPLGQHIAVARDDAFAFFYPHVAEGWRSSGSVLSYFSPLDNESPPAGADAVFLPGGYPELHAETLSRNHEFLDGLRHAANRNCVIYGECGGYMVLGEQLIDRDGTSHKMANLLPVRTSFAKPRLTLGYRQIENLVDGPLGVAGMRLRGHEFHYSSYIGGKGTEPLFHVWDAAGRDLATAGCRRGSVAGSYIHLVDQASEETLSSTVENR